MLSPRQWPGILDWSSTETIVSAGLTEQRTASSAGVRLHLNLDIPQELATHKMGDAKLRNTELLVLAGTEKPTT